MIELSTTLCKWFLIFPFHSDLGIFSYWIISYLYHWFASGKQLILKSRLKVVRGNHVVTQNCICILCMDFLPHEIMEGFRIFAIEIIVPFSGAKLTNFSFHSYSLRTPKFSRAIFNQKITTSVPVGFRIPIPNSSDRMLKIAVKSGDNSCALLLVQNYSVSFDLRI